MVSGFLKGSLPKKYTRLWQGVNEATHGLKFHNKLILKVFRIRAKPRMNYRKRPRFCAASGVSVIMRFRSLLFIVWVDTTGPTDEAELP